nr:putative glutamine amidotransferase PB2B2.05 [Tanacetum cinerariifolium]
MEIDQHSFNDESALKEVMPNHDSSITISSKIDSLFDEFAGELTLLKSVPPGIDETDCHPEKEICLTKRLLYDNSSPLPSKEIVSDNSNADIESFSPSPIPNKDKGLFPGYLFRSLEGLSQKEMLLFVASLLQETYNGHKLLKESNLKLGLEFLKSNITLSLQQENRLKQMGTIVTNASLFTKRSKEIETKIE